MQELTDLLLEDYGLGRSIDGPSLLCRPDSEAVEKLTRALEILLFPGFCGSGDGCGSRAGYVSMIAAEAFWRLDRLLGPLMEGGTEVCRAFLWELPKIRAAMALDLEAFLASDPAACGAEEIIVSYPGFYAIWVQRLAHSLHQKGVPLLPRMMTELAHSRTGIDIHPGAELGQSFFIDHGTGVVIGETTTVGNNVKIYQGVTLGALSTRGGQQLRGKKRHPAIEDAVTIYAGASILGGKTVIGKGSVIGANAFVTASVEPGSLVIGHRTDP